MILHRPDLLEGVIGASEETTTGILKLRAMDTEQALTFPVLAANDARMKHLFDNRYGTGHSSIVSLLSNTNLFLSGKTVVVMGFGWVGRGLAKYAKGMGARVVVCEPEPVKLLEAYAEGYEAMNSLAAAEIGDVFITGTGNLKVLGSEHFARMKDGVLLANAGHYDHEFDLAALAREAVAVREARRNVTEYEMEDGRRFHVIARRQSSTSPPRTGIRSRSWTSPSPSRRSRAPPRQPRLEMTPGLHTIPDEIDEYVARTKLATLGVEPEELTEEQIEYLTSWR